MEIKMNLGNVIALVALLGGGTAAWVDVKEDIRENQANIETSKEADERIERKIDKIYDYLLEQNGDSDNEEG